MGQGHSRRGNQGSVIPRGSVPVVGLLLAGDRTYPSVAAFSEAMEELGYKDGETVRLEARFADGRLDELPRLAEDLVRCGVDVIAVVGAVTYWAARKAAPDLPILFAIVLDPVAAGMVDNAQRPGGMETGCTTFDPEQIGEQIHLLKMVVPRLRRLAVLGDAGVPDILANLARLAAEKNGLDAHVVLLKGMDDLAPAFAEITANGAEALVCLEVPRIATYGAEIVRLAAAARLPAIFARDHARYDPLTAYGTSLAAAARRMAFQVEEVLRGTAVGEIPIQVIIRPGLIINLNAARELGISLPSDLLRSAHKVLG
jgi:putative tryptophan/tyrosine transport system substrate-binding protein